MHACVRMCACVCLQLKKAGDKDIDDIRTLMEEVDMRIAETRKDTYEVRYAQQHGAYQGLSRA